MPRLLICDDEAGLRAVIKKYAEFQGYQVEEAADGMEALELCKQKSFDVIIMDVMMPHLDGFSALKEIRKKSDVPVLMLSARGEEYDKVLGFELGVDDYVVNPFSSKEIMMRIEAILRRSQRQEKVVAKELYEKEGLKVDMTAYKVYINEEPVSMALKEYELLFYLIKNKNIVVTRENLLNEIWGYDYYGDERTLDTHMKLLRKSLGGVC